MLTCLIPNTATQVPVTTNTRVTSVNMLDTKYSHAGPRHYTQEVTSVTLLVTEYSHSGPRHYCRAIL